MRIHLASPLFPLKSLYSMVVAADVANPPGASNDGLGDGFGDGAVNNFLEGMAPRQADALTSLSLSLGVRIPSSPNTGGSHRRLRAYP